MNNTDIHKCLPTLEKELLEEIAEHASIKQYSTGDFIVKQGTYIRFLPIVLKGSVKVWCDEDTLQFLLYHITPGDACIFSYVHTMNQKPIEFSAIAEIESELLLLPIDKVTVWIEKYISFNAMLISAHQKHYNDLLTTTKQLVCYNLEERLLNFLTTKAEIEGSDLLAISHQDIANDLGTSREVISRLMLKLSTNKKINQQGRKIKVL